MKREELGDLLAFVAVSEERSFTRAAAKLGVSQSALSQTMRRLEERLGLRLLTRSTRSVSPTEAGEKLLRAVAPALQEVEAGLVSLGDLRDRPTGNFRISAGLHAVDTILWPALSELIRTYPDIGIEFTVDHALRDIVADGYDAGVRLGEQVAKDMIAVRIGPDVRMVAVGSPAYFAGRAKLERPQDLTAHDCINIRMPTYGGLYVWEFERNGHELKVRVEGRCVFNSTPHVVRACLEGFGIAFVMEDQVRDHLLGGALVQVLGEWCPLFPGYHLYYPSRRQSSPAFALMVEALRYRPRN